MKNFNEPLHIVLLQFDIHIPSARSLKDKRRTINSLKEKIRARFNISIAEFGYRDKWQRSLIGACMLSGDKYKLESEVSRLRLLCEDFPQLEIIEATQEWL